MKSLAALLLLALTACAPFMAQSPLPFAPRPILQAGSPQPQPLIACPPMLYAQGQFVMSQLARVRLGADKLTTQSILGAPLRAESFLLSDGGMAEINYYPTPQSACGRPNDLLPLVFQNNRLIGYGSQYYHDFVVPSLKTPLQMPRQTQAQPQPVQQPQLTPTAAWGAYGNRMMQEDLPHTPAAQDTPQPQPASFEVPVPQNPYNSGDYPASAVGRGTPLN